MTEPRSDNTYLKVELGGRVYTLRHGELLNASGTQITLRAKSARMLEFLIVNHGRLVEKDDLAAAVWPGQIASDESIAQCVADIRRALDDTDRKIITTYPKRGYRLNASFPEAAPKSSRPLVLAALAVVAVVTATTLIVSARQNPEQQPVDRKTVAVLPFENDAGDQLDYIAVGLAEDLIFQLSDVSAFSVIPSSRSFAYSGKSGSVQALTAELGARYFVTGHLRQTNDAPKVTVELVDGESGTNLWAARFGTEPREVSRFHNQIVGEIAKAMDMTLSSHDLERLDEKRVENPEALDLVLRGRRLAGSIDYSENLAAEKLFRRAIAIDPDYARAHAEVAAAYAIRLENNWAALSDVEAEKALYFGRRSVELDPALWLGHYALGRLYSLVGIADIDASERHLRTAMSLQPDDDDARVYFASVQIFKGRAEDALPILEAVIEANPAPKFWYYLALGHALFHTDQNEAAAEAFDKCLIQMPVAPYCLRFQIANYAEMEQFDDAEWALEEYIAAGFDPDLDAMISALPELHAQYAEKTRQALSKVGVH